MDSFRTRPRDRGAARARDLALRTGRELRIARATQGLSQLQVAEAAGVSQSVVADAEAGDLGLSLDVRSRLAAACGHELSIRLYPVRSIRLRDSGQLALAEVITRAAHHDWRPRLEVPTGPGPYQAADLVLEGEHEVIHIEIERGLVDFQAQLRAATLKRDALAKQRQLPVRLVLAVPDGASARARIEPIKLLVRQSLPASSRRVWSAIRTGERLGEDGLMFVRCQ